MILKIAILIICLVHFFAYPLYAQAKAVVESNQQINDFSLVGYGERGKKSWDLSGKTADIFEDKVSLKTITGNFYGEDEDVKLTADSGDFNKLNSTVHLEQNVVITTSSGTKLTTDSLDWDRKNQVVRTEDVVNILRDNIVTVARGAVGQPGLKKVALEKDVRLDINPAAEDKSQEEKAAQEKIVITCEGPLEIDYGKNIASFYNNVKVERDKTQIFSDRMDVYFIASKNEEKESEDAAGTAQIPAAMTSKIDKIVARGNVKIVQGENVSYSEEATYSAADKKIILSGRPKLIIYSTEDLKSASSGN